MSNKKSRGKTEAATSAPLTMPPALQKDDPVERLLSVLLDLGLAGNIQAAKLYLDAMSERLEKEPAGMTADDAIKLLQQRS
jgi:hypothetical protein